MSEDSINGGRPETLTTLTTLTKKKHWKMLSREVKHGLETIYEFSENTIAEVIKDYNSLFGFLPYSIVTRDDSKTTNQCSIRHLFSFPYLRESVIVLNLCFTAVLYTCIDLTIRRRRLRWPYLITRNR